MPSLYVTIESQPGGGGNALSARTTGLAALSTISAAVSAGAVPAIRLALTTHQALTCYVTGFYVAQTLANGSYGYVYNPLPGVFSGSDNGNTFPYKLYKSLTEFNTLTYGFSATGQECASGQQTGVIYWTLSSTAISGTNAGNAAYDVLNNVLSFNNGATYAPVVSTEGNVWCVNTPFPPDNPVYTCFGEFARKQQYLG